MIVRRRSWIWALSVALVLQAPGAIAADKRKASADKESKISPDAQVRLGKRFEALGDTSAALGLYQQVLQQKPDHDAALRGLISLAVRSGLAADAYDYCVRLAAKNPNDPEAAIWLATALNARNQPAEALKQLSRAETMKTRPDFGALWTQRAIAFDLSGDHAGAQKAFSQAISLAPADRTIPLKLALSFAIAEDYPSALRILQMQVNDPAMEKPVRETLALVYALSGQTDAALEIASTAVPKDTAEAMRPYFESLAKLKPNQKALAIYFQRLPSASLVEGLAGKPVGALPSSPESGAVQPASASVQAAPQNEISVSSPAVAAPSQPVVSTTQKTAAPVAAASAPASAPAPVTAPADAVWLQIASFNDRQKLASGWQDVQRMAASALGSHKPYIQTASVGGSAQYRLLIGPFQKRDEAAQVLEKLSDRGIKTVIKRDVRNIEPLHR